MTLDEATMAAESSQQSRTGRAEKDGQQCRDGDEDGECRRIDQVVDELQHHSAIVVGAGAAGLSAAHILQDQGIDDVIILEASNVLGGRCRKDDTFADYPLDLGASFVYIEEAMELMLGPGREHLLQSVPGTDLPVFVNYTWYDFLEEHVAPTNPDDIIYGCQVDWIDYDVEGGGGAGAGAALSCAGDERMFSADYVIVTVPLPVLKDGDIQFEPPLPPEVSTEYPGWMWEGFKVFVEFSEAFYPSSFCFQNPSDEWEEEEGDDDTTNNNDEKKKGLRPSRLRDHPNWKEAHSPHDKEDDSEDDDSKDGNECLDENGENLFWDASSVHPERSSSSEEGEEELHILGAYMLGEPSRPYLQLSDEQIVREAILDNLDRYYDGLATASYTGRHVVVNWSKEPFIRGTMAETREGAPPPGGGGAQNVRDTVFLAGEAFPVDGETGWVHAAMFSGIDAAEMILALLSSSAAEQEEDDEEEAVAES